MYASVCKCIFCYAIVCLYDTDTDTVTDTVNVTDTVTDTAPYGVKRENKRKNYFDKKNNVPNLLRDEPSYDIDAFTRKAIGLKYEKKDNKNNG